MGTTITLTTADGRTLSAYRADPKTAPKGGLVVVQEIFGVNAHMQSVCDFYASKGYTAVAPAIFDQVQKGYTADYGPAELQVGIGIAGKLDQAKIMADITAAAEVARGDKKGARVAIVGFCLGGSVAATAAVHLGNVFTAAVSYYGGGVTAMTADQPKIPLLCHFGKKDKYIANKDVKKLRSAWTTAIIHQYPADHGFNRDGSETYHQASARKAAKRSLDFLSLTVSQRA
jgi:carboxymethylenebutenolidase